LTTPNHEADGCVITLDALPGVQFRLDQSSKGDTLTHELGHWFDLRKWFRSQFTP
jgi:hypothetical protein